MSTLLLPQLLPNRTRFYHQMVLNATTDSACPVIKLMLIAIIVLWVPMRAMESGSQTTLDVQRKHYLTEPLRLKLVRQPQITRLSRQSQMSPSLVTVENALSGNG